ncbi:hypothetical protein L6R53_04150 [Myxococcota bacterium]|nr:hypothetical protein [Myxococcota bacterium]
MARSLPAPAWALAGVVLGFIAGGYAPNRALAEHEDEVARLQDELVKARRQASRRSPLSMVGLDRAGAPQADPPQAGEDPDAPGEAPAGPAPGDEAGDSGAAPVVAEGGPPRDPMAEFDLAVQAQRVRIEQSRAALIEQGELDDAQVAALDQAMAEMNDRLAELGPDLLRLVESGEEPDSRDLLGVTHDVTGILYEAQTELDQVIGDEALDQVDPQSREVWNYVDLDAFRDTVQAAGGVDGMR